MKNVLIGFFLCLPFFGLGQVVDSVTIKMVDSLIQMSRALTGQRDFEKALEISTVAEKIALEKLGRESAAYGSCCFNKGKLNFSKGDYPEAEKWYLESKVIREKALGREHPDYASSLNGLAISYKDMGNYDKAEPLFLEAKAIRETALGKEHNDYAWSLNNLAALYWNMGNYGKAEPLFLEAKDIWEKVHGKGHPTYAASLYNLSILYTIMGYYEKAESFSLGAKDINGKVLGREHSSYAASLDHLAILYLKMGNYEKAEPLFLEAKDIREKVFGKEHPLYAASPANLAILYKDIGNYEKAESYFLEAKDINEKVFGKEHPDYANDLYNLSNLYWKVGNYEKAEPLFLEVKAIYEKALGKEHPDYANSLHNLAISYFEMSNYEKAEPLYLEAKAIQEKALGKENPYNAGILNSLASLYETQRRFTNSEPLLKEYFELTKSQLSQSTTFLSERELAKYAATFQASGNKLSSYLLTRPKRGGQAGILPALSYDQTLYQKGFLLTASSRLNTLATSSPETEELYNQLKGYRRRLAAEISKPIAERKGVEDLEEKANTLEKDLARSVAGYGESMRQVKWDEVQAKLQANEAVIEFVHFQYHDKKATDSILYAALLLRPGWEQPQMVYLCEQRQLDSLLNESDATAAVQKLYATRGVTPSGKALSQALYRLLWQPLDSLLEGVTTVHLSPSGSLHRIAFNAIPTDKKGEVLADRYKLNQLFSTRSLVVQSVATTPEIQSAALFGGISYETNWSADSTANDSTEIAYVPHSTSLLNPNRSHRGDGWSYLPGTKQEVDRLSKLLAKQGYGTATFTDTVATEERFKQLGVGSPSPAILHIATHGFFFPDPALKKSQGLDFGGSTSIPLSEHPLMRSGLLLAGANKAWKEGKPFPGREDGILTAYEIAQVNLTGTKLAVLSACETGLGDIQGSEGVMGLQRSLKMAGVEKLIVSLWAIPDTESAVFMEMFYTKWLAEGKEIRDAFYETQRWMRKRYKDPLKWAGFVLVE